jgi:hypothetical protein
MKTYFSRWRAMVLSIREVIVEPMKIPRSRIIEDSRREQLFWKQNPSLLMMMKRASAGPCKGTKLVGNRSSNRPIARAFFPEMRATGSCLRSHPGRLDLERISSTSITEVIPFSLALPTCSFAATPSLKISRQTAGQRDISPAHRPQPPKLGTLILAHHQGQTHR